MKKPFMQFPPKNNPQSELIMQGVRGCGEVLKGRAQTGVSGSEKLPLEVKGFVKREVSHGASSKVAA